MNFLGLQKLVSQDRLARAQNSRHHGDGKVPIHSRRIRGRCLREPLVSGRFLSWAVVRSGHHAALAKQHLATSPAPGAAIQITKPLVAMRATGTKRQAGSRSKTRRTVVPFPETARMVPPGPVPSACALQSTPPARGRDEARSAQWTRLLWF